MSESDAPLAAAKEICQKGFFTLKFIMHEYKFEFVRIEIPLLRQAIRIISDISWRKFCKLERENRTVNRKPIF